MLEHLSRLNETAGAIVLGATNYPDIIDPAVIRPGRFDVHLEIGNTDRNAIVRILRHAIGETGNRIDVGSVADSLLDSSGAQLVAIVKEAKGLARRDGSVLEKRHLIAVSERIPVLWTVRRNGVRQSMKPGISSWPTASTSLLPLR